MKVTVIIIPTNLVINSFLALCFPSVKKTRIKFQQVDCLVTKNITLFCL